VFDVRRVTELTLTERTGSADDTARRFDVELFLVHPTSRPADISTALGMEAHLAHRVGDRGKTPTRAERDEIPSVSLEKLIDLELLVPLNVSKCLSAGLKS
jgi:hypothetical protein